MEKTFAILIKFIDLIEIVIFLPRPSFELAYIMLINLKVYSSAAERFLPAFYMSISWLFGIKTFRLECS